MGVYAAVLRFDANGDVIGLDAPPAFLVSVGVAAHEFDGIPVPDVGPRVSFSPDMTKLVADHYYTSNGLRVVEIATGAETPLVSGWAKNPAWSLDGAKIAFVVPASSSGRKELPAKIDVVSSNGTGRATVFTAYFNEYLYSPAWSPDSAHLGFQLQSLSTYPWTDDVYRVSASGGKAVNLTADITIRAYLMGWR
jgi:Tol biopolymer transport system component